MGIEQSGIDYRVKLEQVFPPSDRDGSVRHRGKLVYLGGVTR